MIAIIPARSGSKGLPGKNIKSLCGKPMIAYTIESALKSKYITEVIISTDCKEIEKIALKYGAKSYFLRPNHLASNDAKAIDVYIYTIEKLINEYDYIINEFIVLQPTSPLRKVDDVNSAIDLFFGKKADSVISYTKENHPIEWHQYINLEGKFEKIFNNNKLLNRQESRESYYPNGAIFIFKYNLIKQNKYYNSNSYAFIMPIEKSIDIDTRFDFEIAEYLIMREHND
jgi:N-acylneuraminate cytidylyltransferase/CMP-N,N'-diacetyllegionaminic acid synthase